jgi:hypothetical protein
MNRMSRKKRENSTQYTSELIVYGFGNVLTIFSQPVGTTGVESTNFYWGFGLRSVNPPLKLKYQFFNARSKCDTLTECGKRQEWSSSQMLLNDSLVNNNEFLIHIASNAEFDVDLVI